MVEIRRRDFLKAVGLAGTSAAVTGCSEPTRRLIPYVIPPEDVVPGTSIYYATTCRECPAGCGIHAKNRDGHIIKLEGNPTQPISKGTLCPRGQASLHGLYNPDRIKQPVQRDQIGDWQPISWEKGEGILVELLKELAASGRGDRIFFITDLMTGTLNEIVNLWLSEMGNSAGHIMYEPFAYESLRKANQIVFGRDAIPSYKIDQADFLISFNAGFLETWLSNLEFNRQFGTFRTLREDGKNPFVFVGPRQSMTAANADIWIPVEPGDEYLIGLGIIRAVLDDNLAPSMNPTLRPTLSALVSGWTMEKITARTGVSEQLIRRVAQLFANAKKPLAIAEGLPFSAPNSTETAVAANLLCTISPGTRETIDFGSSLSYGQAAPASAMLTLLEKMKRGEVELLIIHKANPVYNLPSSWGFAKAMRSVPTVVSFSECMDETTALSHIVLPTDFFFETWGDYSPRNGISTLLQPIMGRVFDTRDLGDILISTGKKIRGEERFPWKDFHTALQDAWKKQWQATAPESTFETFWQEAVQRGGAWDTAEAAGADTPFSMSSFSFPGPDTASSDKNAFPLTTYPTVLLYDGREANRMWIQEIPDPITMTTWGGWVDIHPETAKKLGIEKGDVLRVASEYGAVEAPANPIFTVAPGVIGIPLGQGHTNYGRYANGLPANPMGLFPAGVDSTSGSLLRPALNVKIEKLDRVSPIANTDGSFYDHGREILETMSLQEYKDAVTSGHEPHITPPMPQGYKPERDFYPPHVHIDYRWAMVIDVDRCTGCSACTVACYAENNLAVVGREGILRGRDMSWFRLERYFDEETHVPSWLPMLCQHCDAAPCEAVCPIYAPHHSKEGLNNQVYNRCFGTRFCYQNDPYKVRRFNWFTYTRPSPLDWQLNPDVTVRQKGVMEKCSFCIQRIVEAKTHARNEGRKVRNGEFTTACAQTCPTGAITFGSFLDPDGFFWKMTENPRAYQVMGHLNTKPAIIYLKKIKHALVEA